MTRTASPTSEITPDLPARVAIDRLLTEHGPRLYAIARRLCRTHEDAEDLVQETMLRAYRKWDQFDGRSDVTTWLYTIAARICRRMHRPRAGQPRRIESLQELLPLGEPLMAVVPWVGEEVVSEAERREMQDRVEEAIAELPESFRLPLILKEIAGLSIEQVASVLGLKPATVKTRIHRARLRVRDRLSRAWPKKPLPPRAYPLRICLDLLRAKQEALDRGVPFPEAGRRLVCDRCKALFESLDVTTDLCRQLGQRTLDAAAVKRLREAVEKALDNGR